MKKRLFQLGILLIVFAFTVCAAVQIAWANPKYQKPKVYVIGDSLSDPGNLYELTFELYGKAGAWPPSPPYKKRYSNGPVWTEYFAKLLRVKVDSFAYGGAFTGAITLEVEPDVFVQFYNLNSIQNPPQIPNLPGVPQEVEELLAHHPGALDPDALYVIWAGANDFFFAVDTAQFGLLQTAAENIQETICSLSMKGARHFAVANLPNIGLTPLGQGNAEELKDLTEYFNDMLAFYLGTVRDSCENPPDTLVILDVFTFLGEVVDHPRAYGLKNVTEPCLTWTSPTSYKVCKQPQKYLFWDDVHPTTAGHALLAKHFLTELCDCGAEQHHWWLNHGHWGKEPPPFWRQLCSGAH
jgi:outer membrane lipase/esterase